MRKPSFSTLDAKPLDPSEILGAFFHHTNLMIACLDRDLRFVAVNQAYAQIDGRQPEDFKGRGHFELYPNPDNEKIFRRVIETGEAHYASARPFEYAHNPERGVTHWDWSLVPLTDSQGRVTGAVLSLLNVTTRIKAIEELHASDDALRTFIDSLTDAAALIDQDGEVIFVNSVGRRMLARTPDEAPDATFYDLLPEGASEGLHELVDAALFQEKPVELVTIHGGRFFENRVFPVRRGERLVLAVLSRDVTAQHEARRSLEQALREQDVLLREIHHRVKNNLQIVSSLMFLQSKQVADPRGSQAFELARSRIRAMALVHETLYGSDSLAAVHLGPYLRQLIGDVRRSYEPNPKVRVEIQCEELAVPADVAAPCGLIAVEVVTNALKYAFPQQRGGTIRAIVRSLPEHRIEMTISDDGVGLPSDLSLDGGDTMGLKLVDMLGRQLGGKVELSSAEGTSISVVFPERPLSSPASSPEND